MAWSLINSRRAFLYLIGGFFLSGCLATNSNYNTYFKREESLGDEAQISVFQEADNAIKNKNGNEKILNLLLPYAESGNVEAQYKLALIYLDMGNHDATFQWINHALSSGEPKVQFALGLLYENGFGTNIDYNKAFKLYKMSAQQNYPEAVMSLGRFHHYGIGEAQVNSFLARKYYQTAVKLGAADAKEYLADLESDAFKQNMREISRMLERTKVAHETPKSVGNKICKKSNEFGYVEAVSGDNIKVLITGKVVNKKPDYFFNNLLYNHNVRLKYQAVNTYEWDLYTNWGLCDFNLTH